MMVKIKSFEDAVKSAIEQNHDDDVLLLEEECRRFDSIYGITRLWYGWGHTIEVWETHDGEDDCVYDGEYFIPTYCIEEIINEQDS